MNKSNINDKTTFWTLNNSEFFMVRTIFPFKTLRFHSCLSSALKLQPVFFFFISPRKRFYFIDLLSVDCKL